MIILPTNALANNPNLSVMALHLLHTLGRPKWIYCNKSNLPGKNSLRNDQKKEFQWHLLMLYFQIKELYTMFWLVLSSNLKSSM